MLYKSALYQTQIKNIAKKLSIANGTVFVSGATGLIGAICVDVLVAANRFYDRNFNIIAIGRDYKKFKQRFSYLESCEEVEFIEQDITDEIKCEKRIDYFIHAASNADPRLYVESPVETILTNIQGTKNVLKLCRKNSGSKFVFLSSFEVYGKKDCEEYSEIDIGYLNYLDLRSCYPESKRCAENLVLSYGEEYQVNARIARLCSIYGPDVNEKDSKAHSQFMRNALDGKNIVLKSEGLQKRTYMYVMDAVDAIFVTLNNGNKGECYNISNEQSISSIVDLARCISKIAKVDICYDIPKENEKSFYSKPQNIILNNDKLKDLGWEGKYKLIDGLESTYNILKEIE